MVMINGITGIGKPCQAGIRAHEYASIRMTRGKSYNKTNYTRTNW